MGDRRLKAEQRSEAKSDELLKRSEMPPEKIEKPIEGFVSSATQLKEGKIAADVFRKTVMSPRVFSGDESFEEEKGIIEKFETTILARAIGADSIGQQVFGISETAGREPGEGRWDACRAGLCVTSTTWPCVGRARPACGSRPEGGAERHDQARGRSGLGTRNCGAAFLHAGYWETESRA
jgi:hypothetical protein